MAWPTSAEQEIDYPDSDGRPMAETEIHRVNLTNLIAMLQAWYADDANVYVSGNMFVYYVEGDRHRHVSPDVFVAKGVPKRVRDCYKFWEEGKGVDLVIELTSRSTRDEDIEDKYRLYEQVLRVPEYVLFDPKNEYLKPRLRGFSLRGERYEPIEMSDGRLPSQVVDLHFEASGKELRLYNPATTRWLPTPEEARRLAEEARRLAEDTSRSAEEARRKAEEARRKTEDMLRQANERERTTNQRFDESEAARLHAEAEIERLRRLLKERGLGDSGS